MNCSLLVYRNTMDFGMLRLHPWTNLVLAVFCICSFLRFSTHRIMSLINEDSLYFLFQSGCFLFHFLALAGTLSTMWNIRGECGDPCLIPNLKEKTFRFSPLKMMPAVGFCRCCLSGHLINALSITESEVLVPNNYARILGLY